MADFSLSLQHQENLVLSIISLSSIVKKESFDILDTMIEAVKPIQNYKLKSVY